MEEDPFSHFPVMEAPGQSTAEDLIGRTLPNVEYVVPMMISPKDLTGRRVAESAWYAHEAIGGNLALAQWALANRSKFYTTFLVKMLPQASSPIMQDQREMRFRLSVPVKALDITDVEDLMAPVVADLDETQQESSSATSCER